MSDLFEQTFLKDFLSCIDIKNKKYKIFKVLIEMKIF